MRDEKLGNVNIRQIVDQRAVIVVIILLLRKLMR